MKGGGRERRWGSRVTRPDAELAQNVVCFLPQSYSGAPLWANTFFFFFNKIELDSVVNILFLSFLNNWGGEITTVLLSANGDL